VPQRPEQRVIARHKRAAHDYDLGERYEAGIVLTGTEVKSLREGRASLAEGWVAVEPDGAWLHGVHIPEYSQGTWNNHSVRRPRRLLLRAAQLDRISRRLAEGGFTMVPLSLYFSGSWAKVEVAVARGKRDHDKRQALRERQDRLDAERVIAAHRRRHAR
jgi:SsrA-binding protein